MLSARGLEKLARIKDIQDQMSALEGELEIILMGEMEDEKVDIEPEHVVLNVRRLDETPHKKGAKVCKNCGRPGHMKKTCPDGPATAAPAAPKRKRGEACEECGSLSSRHKKDCSQAGGPTYRTTSAARIKEEEVQEAAPTPAIPRTTPITQDQFKEVKRLFHQDKKMGSEIVKITGLPIEEITTAVESNVYGIYIFKRRQKVVK